MEFGQDIQQTISKFPMFSEGSLRHSDDPAAFTDLRITTPQRDMEPKRKFQDAPPIPFMWVCSKMRRSLWLSLKLILKG